tara:strand:- start:87 stop:284 length:198 start_codon:yes stop_codon:yes gene_type:complete
VFFSKETILFMMCCLLIGLDGGNLLFEKEGKRNGKKKSIKCFCFLKKVHWVAAEAIDSGTTVDDS